MNASKRNPTTADRSAMVSDLRVRLDELTRNEMPQLASFSELLGLSTQPKIKNDELTFWYKFFQRRDIGAFPR